MANSKHIDRKTFLNSTVATFASVALGCSEDASSSGDTGGTMGGTTGGGTTMGSTSMGGASTTGASTMDSTSGPTTGSTTSPATTGSSSTGDTTGDTTGAGGTSSTTDSTTGTDSGGMGGSSGGMGGTSTSDGGTGGMGAGGTAGSGGSGYMCETEVAGMHTHPLTVPSSDVEYGFQASPYILEDGGTGHTHTLEITAYEFLYLQAGTTVMKESSEDSAHTHTCTITCTPA